MNYSEWSAAIGSWMFSSERADENVFLSVDPSALVTIAHRATKPQTFESPEAAVEDFVKAIRKQVNTSTGWRLVRTKAGQPPSCLGLLAFQVLAVFMMADDENWTHNAYWPRVFKLLDEDKKASLPSGLSPDLQQQLWRKTFADWANNVMDGRLGRVVLPEDSAGHRHMKLPLSQALLRTEDLNRLPRFYQAAGFRAAEGLSPTVLERHARNQLDSPDHWTRHAVRVLSDQSRRAPALVQICDHLSQWDGQACSERERRSVGSVRAWAAIRLGRTAKVTGGFVTRDRTGRWQKMDGHSLTDVVRGSAQSLSPTLAYRAFDRCFRLFVKSENDGFFLECRSVRPGDRVLFLVDAKHKKRYRQDLERWVESSQVEPGRLEGLPKGWSLLHFRLKDDITGLSPDWFNLIVECPRLLSQTS